MAEIVNDRNVFRSPQDVVNTGLKFDMVVIPSGGLNESGEPYDFVKTRLDWAGEVDKLYFAANRNNVTKFWMSSGQWSSLKPPLRDQRGQPLSEARADALYLTEKFNVHGKVILEAQSKDSLGNAYFSRIIAENLNVRNILVVTNAVQMPRMKLLFEWVMTLSPDPYADLYFLEARNTGMTDEQVKLRTDKEAAAIKHFWFSVRPDIESFKALTKYIYFHHQAYALDQSVLYDAKVENTPALMTTY